MLFTRRKPARPPMILCCWRSPMCSAGYNIPLELLDQLAFGTLMDLPEQDGQVTRQCRSDSDSG